MLRYFAAAFVLGFVGCADEPEVVSGPGPQVRTLVGPDRWTLLGADDDPSDHRPAAVDCPPDSYGSRDFGGDVVFDVETGTCDYMAASQAAMADVAVGDPVSLRIWHFDLIGDPGLAHVALYFGEALAWEMEVPIPSDSELIAPSFDAPVAVSEGEAVSFHLHNHGINSWSLIELSVEN